MTRSPAAAHSEPPSAAPRLVVRTTEVPSLAGTSLLELLATDQPLAWLRRGDGFVAHGEAARIELAGPDRFAAAARWWQAITSTAAVRNELDLPGSGLVAFGSFTFTDRDRRAPGGAWDGRPAARAVSGEPGGGGPISTGAGHTGTGHTGTGPSGTGANGTVSAGPSGSDRRAPGTSVLVVPEIVVGRRDGRAWLTTVSPEPALPLPPELDDLRAAEPPRRPGGVSFADGDITGPDYVRAVGDAVRRINAGELDKVVLARDLLAVAEQPYDLRWPLARLAERYPACWTYSVRGLFGATPEMLVRLENGLVTSRVLAGTIRRSDDDAHDLRLAASLARSSKDLEEHEYAVRSVADALAPHCSSMNVPESPFVLHLPNVMHLATDLAGVITDASTSLDLAAALHPSAAVCGTPTPVALSTIAELEAMDRGRYSGPVGWMDASGNGEWAIALRCAQVDPDDPARLRLYAGAGIVADSIPEAELAETQAKLVPIRDALQA